MITSGASVFINLMELNSSDLVWWSREFHLLTSMATFLSVVAGQNKLVPIAMAFDVSIGLLASFARDPWV